MHNIRNPDLRGTFRGNKNAMRFFTRGPTHEGLATRAIPEDPAAPAELHFCSSWLESHACTSRSGKKGESQDFAFISHAGGSVLAGVLDGFGSMGSFMPKELYRHVLKQWAAHGCRADSSAKVLSLLNNAATLAAGPSLRSMLKRFGLKPGNENFESLFRLCSHTGGGTTAAIVSVFHDGRYFAAGLGDSACYVFGGGGAAECKIPHGSLYEGICEGMSSECQLSLRHSHGDRALYLQIRNLVPSWAGLKGAEGEAHTAEGTLTPDSMLVLVSDGITKNLEILLDGNGNLSDSKGCEDLRQIVLSGCEDSIPAGLIRESKARAMLGTKLVERGGGRVLLPADDDMTALVISLSCQSKSVP